MADFIRQETPPVDCSSRNSYVGMDLSQRVKLPPTGGGGGRRRRLTLTLTLTSLLSDSLHPRESGYRQR